MKPVKLGIADTVENNIELEFAVDAHDCRIGAKVGPI